jgi:hypothetical protein
MPPTDDNIEPRNTNRREFFRKSGAVALFSALPAKLFAGMAAPSPAPSSGSPSANLAILAQLQRIAASSDSRTLTEGVATILTSPEMISLPTYALNTGASILSGFQKDLLRTYLKMAENPAALKSFLTGNLLTPNSIALEKTLISSPSYLTGLAAAAELKAVPSLTPLIDTGIQQLIAGLTAPVAQAPATGVPALDTVLTKLHTLFQIPAATNVNNALLAVAQRSDFTAFVKGLPPSDLVAYIPSDTLVALQLPIDAPDLEEEVLIEILLLLAILFVASNLFPVAGAYVKQKFNQIVDKIVAATHGATLGDVTGVWKGTWLGYDAVPPYTDTWILSEGSQDANGSIPITGTAVRQEAQQYTFSLTGSRVGSQVNFIIAFGDGWVAKATVNNTILSGTWGLDPDKPGYSITVANMPQNHGPLMFTKQ